MQAGPLILVADDEAIILNVITVILRKAGFRVLPASGGTHALQIAEASEEPIFMAVLDMVMPDLGGPQVLTRLRELNREMRVLFISGYTLPPKGIPPGADFLSKPFTSAELLRRVREASGHPISQMA
jgi:two-component system cell cycle sensor histidine kinase/response regulator CckA